jgi:sigma-54 dependent transcriptional regulator, acetoin dehydrogenase operon transcriptional activator AcoR
MVHQVFDRQVRPLDELDGAAVTELGPRAWMAMARKVLTQAISGEGRSVLISHLESLSSSQARALGRILDQLPRGAVDSRFVGTFAPTSAEPNPVMRSLLDRFNTDPFEIVPLRKRPNDIMRFIFGQGMRLPTLSDDAIEQLRSYSWPGNYRQLKEFRRWLARQPRSVVGPADLPPHWSRISVHARLTPIQTAESDAIESAIRTTHGNKSAAATILGLSRSSLYRKMREYRLN